MVETRTYNITAEKNILNEIEKIFNMKEELTLSTLSLMGDISNRDKYFTPSIEDIRVGYEYELYVAGTNTEYIKCVVTLEDYTIYNVYKNQLELGWIRVPYLTKEQIEAEGWEARGKEGYFYDGKQNQVVYLPNNNHIMLITHCTKKTYRELFRGECKDINTFRYICKLLGI